MSLSALARCVSLAAAVVLAGVGFAPTSAAATADQYVALGDSYSSGNGTFAPNLDASCYRSTYAYPYLVAQQRPNTALTFAACQGATTGNIVNGQSSLLTTSTKLVSITIGGNDVGFGNLVVSCTTGSQSACQSAIDTTNAEIDQQLPAKLDAAYGAIKQHAPNRTAVAVLGYARTFGSNISCPAAGGVTADEASQLNATADHLDAVIADRAAAAGFSYQASTPSFTGHDVCSSAPYVNGSTWSPADSWHPTRAGHAQGLAPLVRQVLG